MIRPDPARVERIMADTGMDRLQAVRHEQQRVELVRRSDEARRVAIDRAAAHVLALEALAEARVRGVACAS